MFTDQKDLAISFYDTAFYDYVEACEQTCELYADGKLPDKSDCVRAGTRFKASYEKLKTVIRISNHKFGTNFTMPHLVLDTAWFSKVQ
jgi:hypothetical protein